MNAGPNMPFTDAELKTLTGPRSYVLAVVGPEWSTIEELEARSSYKAPNLRHHLRALVKAGLVDQQGGGQGRGKIAHYRWRNGWGVGQGPLRGTESTD